MTNNEYSKQQYFTRLCADLCIVPTQRQASKYRREKGLVYKFEHGLFTDHDARQFPKHRK